MAIEIRPLHPLFVGEVSGVDITRPLARADVAAIEGGMDRYAVLVFRDQQLTDEQQLAFSRNFGELEFTRGTGISKPGELRLDPAFADVSNLDTNNRPLARDNRRRLYSLGNRLWHSDSSFKAIPAKYSLLSGRIVSEKGGETEFADMRAAYDALDAATKAQIEDLVCEHSLLYSREQLGFDLTAEERVTMQPVRQTAGARASCHRTKVAVPGFTYRHHHRMANAGGTRVHPRSDGTRNAAAIRLHAQMAAVGPGDVGQPPDDASRPPL